MKKYLFKKSLLTYGGLCEVFVVFALIKKVKAGRGRHMVSSFRQHFVVCLLMSMKKINLFDPVCRIRLLNPRQISALTFFSRL